MGAKMAASNKENGGWQQLQVWLLLFWPGCGSLLMINSYDPHWWVVARGGHGREKVCELPTHSWVCVFVEGRSTHTYSNTHSRGRQLHPAEVVATLGALSCRWTNKTYHTHTHTHTFKLVINVYRYYLCPDPLLLALGKSFRWLQTMKCKQITARKLHNMAAKNVDLWVPSGNIIKTMTLQALEHGWWDAVGASKYFPNRRKRQMRLFIGWVFGLHEWRK